MALAEIKVEFFGPGTGTVTSLADICHDVLRFEPNIGFRISPTETIISGDSIWVLAAARHIEQAIAECDADDYLLKISVDERQTLPDAIPIQEALPRPTTPQISSKALDWWYIG